MPCKCLIENLACIRLLFYLSDPFFFFFLPPLPASPTLSFHALFILAGWRAEVINCWDRLSFATSPFFPPVRQLGAYKTMQSECLWNASASLAGWTLLVDALAPPPTPCCCCCCCRCSFRAPSIALVWSHRQRRRLKTREGSAMNKSAVNKDSQRPSFVLNSGKGTLKHQAGTAMFY